MQIALYEKITGKFLTFHRRPMYAKDVITTPIAGSDYSNCAIVLQGPLLKSHHFTLETVRIYKKHFPQALIVISTWNNEDSSYIDKIKQEAVVLLHDKPKYNGPYNINFQIISTCAGIQFARDKKVQYILKTRTDQRMYNPFLLESLIDLITHFPVHDGFHQKKRLVGLSCGNMRGDYYRLADMFLFGDTDDMLLYWAVDLVADQNLEKNIAPEAYLFREYLKKIGGNPSLTLQDSECAYRKHCLFIDPVLVDWYWYKYKRHREFRYTKYSNKTQRSISFLEWLHVFVHDKSRRE